MIGIDGNFFPFMSAVIAASLQLVIWPVKILANVSPESRKLRTSLPATLRLYGKDVPPATIGK